MPRTTKDDPSLHIHESLTRSGIVVNFEAQMVIFKDTDREIG